MTVICYYAQQHNTAKQWLSYAMMGLNSSCGNAWYLTRLQRDSGDALHLFDYLYDQARMAETIAGLAAAASLTGLSLHLLQIPCWQSC